MVEKDEKFPKKEWFTEKFKLSINPAVIGFSISPRANFFGKDLPGGEVNHVKIDPTSNSKEKDLPK